MVLPKMIEMIKDSYKGKTLESDVKNIFLDLVRNCLDVLKPGGYMVINHYMFQYDLDLGYEPELWENMLPIVREWIHELGVGEEVFFDHFDLQWWMYYRKNERDEVRL